MAFWYGDIDEGKRQCIKAQNGIFRIVIGHLRWEVTRDSEAYDGG